MSSFLDNVLVFGYDFDSSITSPNKEELIRLNTELTDIEITPSPIKMLSLNQVTIGAQNFFKRHLKLYPIYYADPVKLISNIRKRNPQTIKEWKKIIIKHRKKISPFSLPLTLSSEDNPITAIHHYSGPTNFMHALKEAGVLFNSIELAPFISLQTIPFYIHEITHSQILCQRGIVQNYNHKELLSFFLELVASQELGEVENSIIRSMINTTTSSIREVLDYGYSDEIVSSRMSYIISIMEAFHLFSVYMSSSNHIKEMIMLDIQKVFDGEIKVEDILKAYDISYDNSLTKKEIMKVLTL